MLVLSRRRGQTVVINDTIRVTIVEIRGDVIRLGFSAPQDVEIYREELYLKKSKERNNEIN